LETSRCWQCQAKLPLMKRLKGELFCSQKHEDLYHQEQSAIGLERLTDPTLKPVDLTERPVLAPIPKAKAAPAIAPVPETKAAPVTAPVPETKAAPVTAPVPETEAAPAIAPRYESEIDLPMAPLLPDTAVAPISMAYFPPVAEEAIEPSPISPIVIISANSSEATGSLYPSHEKAALLVAPHGFVDPALQVAGPPSSMVVDPPDLLPFFQASAIFQRISRPWVVSVPELPAFEADAPPPVLQETLPEILPRAAEFGPKPLASEWTIVAAAGLGVVPLKSPALNRPVRIDAFDFTASAVAALSAAPLRTADFFESKSLGCGAPGTMGISVSFAIVPNPRQPAAAPPALALETRAPALNSASLDCGRSGFRQSDPQRETAASLVLHAHPRCWAPLLPALTVETRAPALNSASRDWGRSGFGQSDWQMETAAPLALHSHPRRLDPHPPALNALIPAPLGGPPTSDWGPGVVTIGVSLVADQTPFRGQQAVSRLARLDAPAPAIPPRLAVFGRTCVVPANSRTVGNWTAWDYPNPPSFPRRRPALHSPVSPVNGMPKPWIAGALAAGRERLLQDTMV